MGKVFVITGQPESGKDTFVELVKSYYPNTTSMSTVDYIKWVSSKFYNVNVKNKDEATRKFLSDQKLILSQYNDFPYALCESAINILEEDEVLFIHIREPEEIKKLIKNYPDTKVVYVERSDFKEYDNVADNDCVKVKEFADVIVNNIGGLEILSNTARVFTENHILFDLEK